MEVKIEEMHQFVKAINIHRISLININIGIKEVDDRLHSHLLYLVFSTFFKNYPNLVEYTT